MDANKPNSLNRNIANFAAAFVTFNFGSGLFIMPQIDAGSPPEIIPLIFTAAFTFLGWKGSGLLIDVINQKSFSSKKKEGLVWSLPLIYLITGISISAVFYTIQTQAPLHITALNGPTAGQELTITVSSQSAQGVTEENMNQAFLKNYEEHILERIRVHIEQASKTGVKTISVDQISSASSYIDVDEKKLAVIRVNSPTDTSVFVLGIVDREATTVTCSQQSQASIPITYGQCGDRIKKTFNLL